MVELKNYKVLCMQNAFAIAKGEEIPVQHHCRSGSLSKKKGNILASNGPLVLLVAVAATKF